MEPKEKMETLQRAIKQLMIEEEGSNRRSLSNNTHESLLDAAVDGDDDDDDKHYSLLLSKLLSQLDSLEEKGILNQLQESAVNKELHPSEISEKNVSEITEKEQIVKELKEIKKQNTLTQGLLSVMIVLTLAWQLSEVSLLLKLKEGLSNPIKSVGSMIMGMFKGKTVNGQQLQKEAAAKQNQILQSSSFPGLRVSDVFCSDED